MTEKFDVQKYMMNMQGNDYLPVAARIAWFRHEHPDGSIDTEMFAVGELVAIKARVIVDGVAIASGMATVRKFERGGADRSIEKAETAAIGRALGIAGYGTLQAGDELNEGDYLADSPQPAPAETKPKRQTKAASAPAPATDDPDPLEYVRAEIRKQTGVPELVESEICKLLDVEQLTRDTLKAKYGSAKPAIDAAVNAFNKPQFPPRAGAQSVEKVS